MRLLIVVAALVAAVAANDTCEANFKGFCSKRRSDTPKCNAVYGGIEHVKSPMQSYVIEQLTASYDYMILATRFNTYQKNRPGFNKMFKELSEAAWERSISLIKHLSKRGSSADFSTLKPKSNPKSLELPEYEALAMALDMEKKLSQTAMDIHRSVSHAYHNHANDNQTARKTQEYDPEIAQYIEEEFLEYQSGVIRKLSGYANDLRQLVSLEKPSLSYFIFDEYLAKQSF